MPSSKGLSKANNKIRRIIPLKLIDKTLSYFFILCIAISICIFIKTLIKNRKINTKEELIHSYSLTPPFMPWQSIGGCGAGGSGGGTDGIKWVGEVVTGGLL